MTVLRETRTQYITINRGGRREFCTLVLRSLATLTSCIDPSERIVTKSPKVGPLLIFSISLVLYMVVCYKIVSHFMSILKICYGYLAVSAPTTLYLHRLTTRSAWLGWKQTVTCLVAKNRLFKVKTSCGPAGRNSFICGELKDGWDSICL